MSSPKTPFSVADTSGNAEPHRVLPLCSCALWKHCVVTLARGEEEVAGAFAVGVVSTLRQRQWACCSSPSSSHENSSSSFEAQLKCPPSEMPPPASQVSWFLLMVSGNSWCVEWCYIIGGRRLKPLHLWKIVNGHTFFRNSFRSRPFGDL